MSWLNMDASVGFHNSLDSNSNCFYQLHDDSLSHNAPLFEDPDRSQYNYDHTLNFANAPFFHQQYQDLSHFQQPLAFIEDDSPEWVGQSSITRKGLKCLAELLLKILKKKPLMQAEIVALVEGILCKDRHQESGKEEKNIKRRIYDALNVMIAAGQLEKEESAIRIKKKSASSEFLQHQPLRCSQIGLRIEKKKQLLAKLMSKKQALQSWIEKNRRNSRKSNENHLYFPLIFVVKEEPDFWMNFLSEFLLMKGRGLQLFSQTDIIETIYAQKDITSFMGQQ